MKPRSDCWDNVAMESPLSSLKIERTHRKRRATRDEMQADVFDYIARFTNRRRQQKTRGVISPIGFGTC